MNFPWNPHDPHLRTHLLDPLHRRINGRQQLLLITFQALGTRQDLAEVAAEAVALPRHRQQQGIDGRFETEIDLGWTWDLRILLGILGGIIVWWDFLGEGLFKSIWGIWHFGIFGWMKLDSCKKCIISPGMLWLGQTQRKIKPSPGDPSLAHSGRVQKKLVPMVEIQSFFPKHWTPLLT